MFDNLNKYKLTGQFLFSITESLSIAAKDVPTDKSGVYIVLSIKKDEIIYIGSTGKMQQDGKLKVRKGGMRDRIVNGKQFEQPRRVSWAIKMKDDRINQILVKWYVTLDEYHKDIPTSMEGQLIQKYFNGHGKLPFWNIEY